MLDNNRNRIPAIKTAEYSNWHLPDIADGKVIEVVHGGQNRNNSGELITGVGGKSSSGPLTVEKLEEITKQAQREGYQAGFEQGLQKGEKQGYQAGLSKGNREIQQRLLQLQQVISQLMSPIDKQDEEVEGTLLALVKMTAEAVIKQELEDNRVDIIQKVITEAVNALPMGAEHIKIFLNSEDFAAVQGEGNGVPNEWQLVSDESINAGGCRVETSQSRIDYSLGARINQVIEQWMESAGTEGLTSIPDLDKAVAPSLPDSDESSQP